MGYQSGDDHRGGRGATPRPQDPFQGSGASTSSVISAGAGSTGGHCCRVILILLFVAALASAGYYYWSSNMQETQTRQPTRTDAEEPPTPTPTATPSPTPEQARTHTPLPTSTQAPAPTPEPGSAWVTWPELQAAGRAGDVEGLPRIVLHSERSIPGTSVSRAALQLHCQRFGGDVQLELYIVRVLRFPIPPPLPGDAPPGIRVAYSVDGDWRSESTWAPGVGSVDTESVFALRAQAEDIIASLKNDAQRLEFTVHWPSGLDDPPTYQFPTRGFEEAFQPLGTVCG